MELRLVGANRVIHRGHVALHHGLKPMALRPPMHAEYVPLAEMQHDLMVRHSYFC